MFGEQTRDVFGGLIEYLSEISALHNPNLKKLGTKKQKDLIHKNG
jgi:hypothetical protein